MGGYIFIPLVLFGVYRACVGLIWGLYVMGLCAVPVLHCVRLALCVVLSFGYILLKVWRYTVNRIVCCFLVALSFCNNPIDSGETIDARQAAKHTPGGGTADSRPSRRELLEFPKISKRTKRPFFVETLKPKRQ